MDILRDAAFANIIASASIVIAVIAIFVSIRLAKQKKTVSYTILSSYPLITVDSEIKGSLKLFLNEIPVDDIHTVIFKLINDGEVPIPVDDFENPIRVKFGHKAEIISVEILETQPSNLYPSYNIEANSELEINPLLLNQGDYLTIKILCTGKVDKNIQVSSRIVGVKNIKRSEARKLNSRDVSMGLSFIALFADLSVIILLLQINFFSGSLLNLSPVFTALIIIIAINAIMSMSAFVTVFIVWLRRRIKRNPTPR